MRDASVYVEKKIFSGRRVYMILAVPTLRHLSSLEHLDRGSSKEARVRNRCPAETGPKRLYDEGVLQDVKIRG